MLAGIKQVFDPEIVDDPIVELEPWNRWKSRALTIWNPCPVVVARNAGRV